MNGRRYGGGRLERAKSYGGERVVYYGNWTDARGKRHRQILSSDRRVAERALAKIIRERDLEALGLADEEGQERRLEEIRDLTFDELLALPTEIDFQVLPATTIFGKPINPDIVQNKKYEMDLRNASGKVFIDTLAVELKVVTIEVTWNPGLSTCAITMGTTTCITRNGINRQ